MLEVLRSCYRAFNRAGSLGFVPVQPSKLGLAVDCPGGWLSYGSISSGSRRQAGRFDQPPRLRVAQPVFSFYPLYSFFLFPHRTVLRCGRVVTFAIGTFCRILTIVMTILTTSKADCFASTRISAMTELLALETAEGIWYKYIHLNAEISNPEFLRWSRPAECQNIGTGIDGFTVSLHSACPEVKGPQ